MPSSPSFLSARGGLSRRAERALLVVVLALHVWLAASVSRTFSTTSDEIAHLTSGYLYWTETDYRFQPENGNLPQRWAALPLLFRDDVTLALEPDSASWREADVWRTGDVFFHRSGNDLPALLAAGRAMNAVLSGVLCLVIFLVARRLFGRAGAWFTVLCAALSPTVLAHAGLITSDTAAALGFLLATWTWWRLLQRVDAGRLAAAAAALGLLALCKYSVVIFAPLALLLLAVRLARPAPLAWRWAARRGAFAGWRRAPALAASGLVVAGAAIVIVWAGYGFRYAAAPHDAPEGARFAIEWDSILLRTPPQPALLMADGVTQAGALDSRPGVVQHFVGWARDHRLLPEAWLYGLAFVEKNARGRLAYFAGEYRMTGWPEFFPAAFIAKSTPPELILGLLSLVALLLPFRRGRISVARAAPVLVLLVLYWAFAVRSHLNIGHRHLLPAYAAMFVLIGAVAPFARRHPAALVAAAGLLLWQARESFAARPDYLPYFNAAVGGPDEAHRLFVDSSLDWGQDLPRLRAWLDRHADDTPVYLSYFGSGSPVHAGIRATRFGDGYFDWETRVTPPRLGPGIYAVSATMLRRVYTHVRGPWSADYEAVYQKLTTWLGHMNTRPPGAPPTDLDGTPLSAEASNARLFTYEQLQFGRLCHYFDQRPPDDRAGKSILLFRLTEAELHYALKGPWSPPAP